MKLRKRRLACTQLRIACLRCEGAIPKKRQRPDTLYCSNLCGARHRNQRYDAKPRAKEKAAARRRWYYENRLNHYMLARAKHRAKASEVPFNLEASDIVIPKKCPVLGIKLALQHGKQKIRIASPSLDRIKSTKGYVKGNVRIISQRANLLKSNATVKELELVLRDLKRLA